MKKSKMFIATGALVLAVTAIFATKANKKFTTVTTAKASNLSGAYIVKGGTEILMTTAVVNGGQLQLQVNDSKIGDLFTAPDDHHGVYYK